MPEDDDQQAACEAPVALGRLDQHISTAQKEARRYGEEEPIEVSQLNNFPLDFDLTKALGMTVGDERRVSKIVAGGQSEELGVAVGDELTHINGEILLDGNHKAVKEKLAAMKTQHKKCTISFKRVARSYDWQCAFAKIQAHLPGTVLWDVLPNEVLKHRNYHCNGTDILADDGMVYLAPCVASMALCLDIEKQTARFIGAEMKACNDAKYSATVKGRDGKFYGIPACASNVVCIDPAKPDPDMVSFIEIFGDCGADEWKWHGGVCAEDGHGGWCIFGIPLCANKVLCIDPVKGTATMIGTTYTEEWMGGVLALNGKIYALPWCAKKMLRIDPETMTTELVGADLGDIDCKWIGGCLSREGMVVGVPSHAAQVSYPLNSNTSRDLTLRPFSDAGTAI
jgi:hypothetical protein